jgi:molecular chaperone GrpE
MGMDTDMGTDMDRRGAADQAEALDTCPDGQGGAAELGARLSDAERSLAEKDAHYTRLLADFQNARNRQSREIQSGVENAEKKIFLEILPVMDNFRRCLDSTYGSVEDFRAGVGLIEKQFGAALRSLGVSEIEVKTGDAFDANVAEAMATIEMPGSAPGSVVDITEKGYMIGERLLRPARVVVAAEGA